MEQRTKLTRCQCSRIPANSSQSSQQTTILIQKDGSHCLLQFRFKHISKANSFQHLCQAKIHFLLSPVGYTPLFLFANSGSGVVTSQMPQLNFTLVLIPGESHKEEEAGHIKRCTVKMGTGQQFRTGEDLEVGDVNVSESISQNQTVRLLCTLKPHSMLQTPINRIKITSLVSQGSNLYSQNIRDNTTVIFPKPGILFLILPRWAHTQRRQPLTLISHKETGHSNSSLTSSHHENLPSSCR